MKKQRRDGTSIRPQCLQAQDLASVRGGGIQGSGLVPADNGVIHMEDNGVIHMQK